MRNAIISMMFLSAALLPTVSVAGQEDSKVTDSLRQVLKKQCIGKATVTKEAPYKTGDYIPTGATYLNEAVHKFYGNMDYDSQFDTSCQKGDIAPDFDYCYMISKGVKNNPNEVGVVYYVYFNKSQCQILKMNTIENKLMAKSEVFNCENLGLNTRFSDGKYNFMGNLRDAAVKSKYSNNTRHNELLQSMVDLNTMDYNGDGIDELFIVFGRTLRIYDGKDLKQLMSYTIRNERDNISPSSVVYDLNGDGINDYLCMYTHMTDPNISDEAIFTNSNCADIDGLLIYSKRDKDGKVTYSSPVKKNVNDRSDFYEKHKKESSIKGIRSTLNMQVIYPDGKNSAPKLALAVNVIRQSKDDQFSYIFDQQLTIIDVLPTMVDKAKDWYKVSGFTTRESKATYWRYTRTNLMYTTLYTYYYNRNVPYLFGRPALCGASVDGKEKPQKIFWVDAVYTYNTSSQSFSKDFEIQGKHKEDEGSGFDRVVGGQVLAIPSRDLSKEEFVFILADSKTETWGDYYREWKDISFKLANVSTKTGKWDIKVIKDYVLDGKSKIMENGKEMYDRINFSLTDVSRDKGMKVRLESKEVTITTPVIDHIICAAPLPGNESATISLDETESQSTSRAISTSSTSGYSLDTSLSFYDAVKFSVGTSYSKTVSNTEAESITKTTGQGLTITNANDYVLFNCYVVDKFDYVIDECESTPELVGSKFSIMRLRENFCRQFDLPVDEFNLLIKGSMCPEITNEILCHTTGDYKTYPHGNASDEEDVKKALNLKKDDQFVMTVFTARSANNLRKISASFNKSDSKTQGETESVTIKASITIDFGVPKVIKSSTTLAWNGGSSEAWSETMTLGEGTSVNAVLPTSKGDCNAYSMLYYKKNITTKEGAPCSFMVVNWYYQANQDGNAKMRNMNFDSDETSGISGIDNTGKEVASVAYYDASGSEHAAPVKGLNIKVTTFADGTKTTVKMMNR